MSIGERIKKVRKGLDLTQQEFADRLRMKRNSIAQVECGRNTSDQTIFSICREFNVSETWLRTGEGEMFVAVSSDPLEVLSQTYHLDNRDRALVEKFLKLKPNIRRAVLGYLMEAVASLSSMEIEREADSQQQRKEPQSDPEIEAEVEAYRQRLLQEKKPELPTSAAKGRGAV